MNKDNIVLQKGSHNSSEEGMCVMEAVAYIAGEPHSDHPICACPVLTSFMIRINDSMTQDERQQLRPYVERLVGTRDGNSAKRLEILVHMAAAQVTPHALRLTALPKLIRHAEILEALKPGDYEGARKAAHAAASRSAADSANVAYAAATSTAATASAAYAAYSAATSSAAYAATSAANSAYSATSAADSAANSAYYATSATTTARKPIWDLVLKALNKALEVGK